MPELIRSVFSRMQTYVQDRRHPPRLPVRLLFTVSPCLKAHGNGLRPECALKGYTRDLSAGGLALKLPQVHLDGHYLADEDSQIKLKLELPTGPISMLVSPRRHEGIEQAELSCKYLIGVQITEISDEDRKRYLSFIFPKGLRSFPAVKKESAPEVARSLPTVQKEIAAEDVRRLAAVQAEMAREVVRSSPAVQKEIALDDVPSLAAVQAEIADEDVRNIATDTPPDAPLASQAFNFRPQPQQERIGFGFATAPQREQCLPAVQTEIAAEDGRNIATDTPPRAPLASQTFNLRPQPQQERIGFGFATAPQREQCLPAVQTEIAPDDGRNIATDTPPGAPLASQAFNLRPQPQQERTGFGFATAPQREQCLPAVQTEIAPEMEVSDAPIEQEPTREGTSWATWWNELAWKPIYQITESSDEDRRRYLRLIAPEVVRSFPAVQREIASEYRRSLPAIQKEIAPELYAPIEQEPTRRGLAWKPIYAAAIIVIGIALVIAAALLTRRAENLRAKEAQASAALAPDDRAANDLSLVTPNESPVENPDSSAAIIALYDRAGMVKVDIGGNLSGLDDVPVPTRGDIAKALLSERILRPAILRELAGKENALGGSENAQPFKLISPSRAVIVSDRPALKWERVSGASSYRVHVNDSAGQEMARSEELPSERTEWLLPKPLKRGETYVWTVVAVVDGQEIASPGPSASAMKFQVLSERNLQELTQLKKTGSNLALGVFYSREGMIPGAEREFEALVRENPGSVVAKKLLTGVQSWQKQPAAANSSSAKNQSVPRAGARGVTVQVTYDENGRVTQAWGGDTTALRIARQKRFPAGKAGSATIRIPIN